MTEDTRLSVDELDELAQRFAHFAGDAVLSDAARLSELLQRLIRAARSARKGCSAQESDRVPSEGNAIRDIANERHRHVEEKGYTAEHDDGHTHGQLALAAAAYAIGSRWGDHTRTHGPPPQAWPWERSYWKPCSPRRMLVKAGSFIVAEIERLDRAMIAAAPPPPVEGGAL